MHQSASAPTYQPLNASPPGQCGNCRSTTHGFTLLTEKPHSGTGCILLVLGVLLLPIVIGFFILIWALCIIGNTSKWWVCNSCGARLPIASARG